MSDNNTTLPEAFDPETQEGTSFDVLPIDWYKAQVTDASVCQPQSGDGYYIALTWQITEGQHEGRYVWQRITFTHSSVQAVNIGRRQFKDLCIATGTAEQVTDVEVFKFVPCQIRVGIEEDKKQGIYPDKNRVSRILPYDAPTPATKKAKPAVLVAKAPAAPKTVASAPSPKAQTNSGSAPWHKPPAPPTASDAADDTVPF